MTYLLVAYLLLSGRATRAALHAPSFPGVAASRRVFAGERRVASVTISTPGLVCQGCGLDVLKALVHTPGFYEIVKLDPKAEAVTIRYNPFATTPANLAHLIRLKTSYSARLR